MLYAYYELKFHIYFSLPAVVHVHVVVKDSRRQVVAAHHVDLLTGGVVHHDFAYPAERLSRAVIHQSERHRDERSLFARRRKAPPRPQASA